MQRRHWCWGLGNGTRQVQSLPSQRLLLSRPQRSVIRLLPRVRTKPRPVEVTREGFLEEVTCKVEWITR